MGIYPETTGCTRGYNTAGPSGLNGKKVRWNMATLFLNMQGQCDYKQPTKTQRHDRPRPPNQSAAKKARGAGSIVATGTTRGYAISITVGGQKGRSLARASLRLCLFISVAQTQI